MGGDRDGVTDLECQPGLIPIAPGPLPDDAGGPFGDVQVSPDDIFCVHFWGAETRYPWDGGWNAFRICARCNERWHTSDVLPNTPEPETVIARIRSRGH